MTINIRHVLVLGFAASISTSVIAGVSQEKADQLGTTLTAVGANPEANADGTIPKWQGAAVFNDEEKNWGYQDILRLQKNDPDRLNFTKSRAKELSEPRLVITASNYKDHVDRLTPGQQAMFRTFKDYKMIVYPTVRTAFFPDVINAASKRNAVSATLEGTDELSGAKLGFPFPIPTSGAQPIWNHKLKFRGSGVIRYNNQAVVDADGGYTISKLIEDVGFEYANIKATDAEREANTALQYVQRTIAPPRVAGQIILVHEIFGKGTSGRNAWIYNPGLGRVNRAPEVGYDNPSLGSDGLQFNDQINMFNGSLDRYNWKLVGKKEVYIPYNSYKLSDPRVKYDDIIQKGHINQDLARYELHRVWVVEANLRDGTRHQFKRRTFYIDEDSWTIALVDCYDNRDQLWKMQEGHIISVPFLPTATTIPEVIYDLQSGRYFVTAMANEDKPNDFEAEFKTGYFSPSSLSRMGTKF